jgi:hypothetical protein
MSQVPDQSRLPLEARLPPPNVASPSQMRLDPAEEVRWYKPGFGESAKLFGWRWIYFIPAALLLALLLYIPLRPEMFQFIVYWWKLVVIAVVLPTGLAINAAKNIIARRKEPFCIHCGYDLTGLPDHHNCPECGRPFSIAIINEYRRDPHWFIERYKKHQDIPRADIPFQAGPVRPKRKSRDGT